MSWTKGKFTPKIQIVNNGIIALSLYQCCGNIDDDEICSHYCLLAQVTTSDAIVALYSYSLIDTCINNTYGWTQTPGATFPATIELQVRLRRKTNRQVNIKFIERAIISSGFPDIASWKGEIDTPWEKHNHYEEDSASCYFRGFSPRAGRRLPRRTRCGLCSWGELFY